MNWYPSKSVCIHRELIAKSCTSQLSTGLVVSNASYSSIYMNGKWPPHLEVEFIY
jgi:hypothetical protein